MHEAVPGMLIRHCVALVSVEHTHRPIQYVQLHRTLRLDGLATIE